MNPLGTHLLLDLMECNAGLLDDFNFIRETVKEAAGAAGATIVGETFHKFDPYGVTGIIAITESHLSIHTWPEHGCAMVDIFTCGSSFNPHKAAELIIESLQCAQPGVIEVQRGKVSDLE